MRIFGSLLWIAENSWSNKAKNVVMFMLVLVSQTDGEFGRCERARSTREAQHGEVRWRWRWWWGCRRCLRLLWLVRFAYDQRIKYIVQTLVAYCYHHLFLLIKLWMLVSLLAELFCELRLIEEKLKAPAPVLINCRSAISIASGPSSWSFG